MREDRDLRASRLQAERPLDAPKKEEIVTLTPKQLEVLERAKIETPPPDSPQLVPIWVANVLGLKAVSYADCLGLANSWRASCSA